jgi:hypothetical protein
MADLVEKPDKVEKDPESWVEDAPGAEAPSPRPKSKLEKRLLLKMDVAIVPLLALSFFIAYMVCSQSISKTSY